MVEGGKIDWACHSNDAATTFHEVIDFDNAIKVAYEFYSQHPDETLIVVTADHETGGFVLGKVSVWAEPAGIQEPEGQWKRIHQSHQPTSF